MTLSKIKKAKPRHLKKGIDGTNPRLDALRANHGKVTIVGFDVYNEKPALIFAKLKAGSSNKLGKTFYGGGESQVSHYQGFSVDPETAWENIKDILDANGLKNPHDLIGMDAGEVFTAYYEEDTTLDISRVQSHKPFYVKSDGTVQEPMQNSDGEVYITSIDGANSVTYQTTRLIEDEVAVDQLLDRVGYEDMEDWEDAIEEINEEAVSASSKLQKDYAS